MTKNRSSSIIAAIACIAFAMLALLWSASSCTSGRLQTTASLEQPVVDAASSASSDAPPPTYWNRIAGILETHCIQCHAPNGIGPMPLVSFEDAKTHAAAIVFETKARLMPPWLPDTSACSSLQHSCDRALDGAWRARRSTRRLSCGGGGGATVAAQQSESHLRDVAAESKPHGDA